MKRFTLILLLASLALFASACGATPPAEPAISPEDIQATAVSAAFTIVAETQAAIPTNTPVPPTETPLPTALPTDTPVVLPTLESIVIPTFTPQPAATSTDPCNHALQSDVAGHPTRIRLVNKTKGTLVVSIYLNLTPFGECGYRGYNMSKNETLEITNLVTGCYNLYVWVTEPNSSSIATGYGCINNSDMWTFEINAESVKFVGP
jgi:hypothetical protein